MLSPVASPLVALPLVQTHFFCAFYVQPCTCLFTSMIISHIEIQNFKSIGHTRIPLQNFTVLVGANAAGKSNIVQAFKFLKDLSKEGLKNALSLQGGSRYFANTQLQKDKDTTFHIQLSLLGKSFEFELDANLTRMLCRLYELDYHIEISANGKDYTELQPPYVHDIIDATGYYKSFTDDGTEEISKKQIDLILSELSTLQEIDAPRTTLHIHTDMGSPIRYTNKETNEDIKLIGKKLFSPSSYQSLPPFFLLEDDYHFGYFLREYMRTIGIYDFSTQAMRQSSPFEGRTELESNGGNLAFVLKNLLDDASKRTTLLNLLSYLLPYIADIHVQQNAGSLVTFITEHYNEKSELPSVFFSDGTISILAVLVVLFFEGKSVVVIEEPERYIHPSLLSQLVELMRDAASTKQIIITTHSPEIVKHAGIDNLLLVQRDKEGFTTVAQPSNSETTAVFLRNELGLDDLFIDNLLGA